MPKRTHRGIHFALITVACGFMSATIGHYAEFWSVSYFVTLVFGLFGGIAVSVEEE